MRGLVAVAGASDSSKSFTAISSSTGTSSESSSRPEGDETADVDDAGVDSVVLSHDPKRGGGGSASGNEAGPDWNGAIVRRPTTGLLRSSFMTSINSASASE